MLIPILILYGIVFAGLLITIFVNSNYYYKLKFNWNYCKRFKRNVSQDVKLFIILWICCCVVVVFECVDSIIGIKVLYLKPVFSIVVFPLMLAFGQKIYDTKIISDKIDWLWKSVRSSVKEELGALYNCTYSEHENSHSTIIRYLGDEITSKVVKYLSSTNFDVNTLDYNSNPDKCNWDIREIYKKSGGNPIKIDELEIIENIYREDNNLKIEDLNGVPDDDVLYEVVNKSWNDDRKDEFYVKSLKYEWKSH